jgi:anaerobic ribonucleoside-triphosphate reductase activating protein
MVQLYIASIRPHAIGEGPGRRTVIFVSGCSIRCPGCQNPHLFERSTGRAMAVDEVMTTVLTAKDTGVSLLGGEPLDQAEGVAKLCAALRARNIHIVVYTGYLYEKLIARSQSDSAVREILDAANVLVDGPYVEALSDENIQFRGSRNQRVIDLPLTRASGTLTLLNWDTRLTIVLQSGAINVPACETTRPLVRLLGEPEAEHVCGHVAPDSIPNTEKGI